MHWCGHVCLDDMDEGIGTPAYFVSHLAWKWTSWIMLSVERKKINHTHLHPYHLLHPELGCVCLRTAPFIFSLETCPIPGRPVGHFGVWFSPLCPTFVDSIKLPLILLITKGESEGKLLLEKMGCRWSQVGSV